MVRINALFHLLINGVYLDYNPLTLTFYYLPGTSKYGTTLEKWASTYHSINVAFNLSCLKHYNHGKPSKKTILKGLDLGEGLEKKDHLS